jgi:hypothetical protein
MMWDHPLGVGWNKAVETYDRHYSPPEGGAVAIVTNDYLMLNAIGIAGLVLFCGCYLEWFQKTCREWNTDGVSRRRIGIVGGILV